MPTTYAHWRFGQDCIETMPDDLKKIVEENIDIFNIGVHGPDIFFYHLTKKDVGAYGTKMHDTPARYFFESCRDVYDKHDEKDMMMAYMLGFLSHFTLDSVCHGYVERKREVSCISHNKVEADWDGHLMYEDGRMVNTVDRAESLRPNKEIARVISYFFVYDEKVILTTTKRQHTVIHALNYVSLNRYNFMRKLLKTVGMHDYADLLISPVEDKVCLDSNMRLDKLRKKAKRLYPKLLNDFMDYMNEGKKLPKYFEHDFEQWPDYRDIPVLSPEEELEYTVR
ncbi:MAG: zinc dependent phospholipase C family protein [Erysipelotrichaceae bacterium]|nr:zinc dependent phospholipase C family protein [Erysipelotrichaceae bacterium]